MAQRILLVDAAATSRILCRALLAEAGQAVVQASGAAAALALARRDPPALAVIDSELAAGQPVELCRALRGLPGLQQLPVLILARRPGAAFRLAALGAGAAEVLEKPLAGELMVGWTRQLLRVAAREAELAEIGAPDGIAQAELTRGQGHPGRIALVAPGATAADWGGLIGALPPNTCQRLDAATAEVGLSPARAPEIVVIEGTGLGEAALFDTLSRFRSLPATRNAAVVVLGAGAGEWEPARLLAMDIDELIPAQAGLAERRLRILRALRRARRRQAQQTALRREIELSLLDPLTGLANRRRAFRRLDELAGARGEAGAPHALLMIDIDRFKRINDRHGHPAGDAVLSEVARRMRAVTEPGELLARIGGEEFLAILPAAGAAAAAERAEALRSAVGGRPVLLPDGAQARVTLSIGLALWPTGSGAARDPAEILARADRALLRAKAAGRNMITLARQAA
ncbi:MAG: diguanylate cyclase [Alphaproteobacteria bacterium]|nr:MAG: diguanylate cyclase [Alphaproteobacteria bacterium]